MKSATYDDLRFTTTVTDYDEYSFTIKVGFENPESVSLGYRKDKLVV